MDPEATLRLIEEAIDNRQWDEALSALYDYWQWRKSGGFPPPDGDNMARAYCKLCMPYVMGKMSKMFACLPY